MHIGEFESAPPEAMYYYKADNFELVMFQVNVGHETYSTKHTYYFKNQSVIKYIKVSFDHPDSPPKKAIIYDNKEKPLWKNTSAPIVKPDEIRQLFRRNIEILKAFSKY